MAKPKPISWVGACPDCKYKGTFGLAEVDAGRIPETCPQCDSADWEGDLVYPPPPDEVATLVGPKA